MAADEAARAEMESVTSSQKFALSLDLQAVVRRIGRNAGIALGGNVVVAGLSFITLALNARALGAAAFGTLVLIISIGALLDRLFALQSWQGVVKLGNEALISGDRQLVATGFLFDIVTALIASDAGIAIALTAAEWLGIDNAYAPFAAIYMATLVTRVVDAPMGVLGSGLIQTQNAMMVARATAERKLAASLS